MDYWKRFVAWCQRPNMVKIRRVDPSVAEWGRGVKLGVASGAIYGPLNWLIINVLINMGSLGQWIAGMAGTIGFVSCIIQNLLFGVLFGGFFGVVLSKL